MSRSLTPRARSTYNRKDSTATLSNPDKSVTVQIKLLGNGDIILGMYRNKNGKPVEHIRRELTAGINWND